MAQPALLAAIVTAATNPFNLSINTNPFVHSSAPLEGQDMFQVVVTC
jgi:hypothetical protein